MLMFFIRKPYFLLYVSRLLPLDIMSTIGFIITSESFLTNTLFLFGKGNVGGAAFWQHFMIFLNDQDHTNTQILVISWTKQHSEIKIMDFPGNMWFSLQVSVQSPGVPEACA